MKIKHLYITAIILSIQLFLLGNVAYSKSFEIIQEKEFGQDLIGRSIQFDQNLVYLNLVNSPQDFLEKNGGIKRMLATEKQANGNDIHEKEIVEYGMTFKLIKILRTIHTNLDSWDKGAREMYLSYSKSHPEVDMIFILEDEKGVKSTVRAGNYYIGKLID